MCVYIHTYINYFNATTEIRKLGNKQFFQVSTCHVTLPLKINVSCCFLTLFKVSICSTAQSERVKDCKLSHTYNKSGNVCIALTLLELSLCYCLQIFRSTFGAHFYTVRLKLPSKQR